MARSSSVLVNPGRPGQGPAGRSVSRAPSIRAEVVWLVEVQVAQRRLHVRVACLLAQIDKSLWFWEPDLLDAAAGIDWERDTRYESRLVRGQK
jgi:hypothetical protein